MECNCTLSVCFGCFHMLLAEYLDLAIKPLSKFTVVSGCGNNSFADGCGRNETSRMDIYTVQIGPFCVRLN